MVDDRRAVGESASRIFLWCRSGPTNAVHWLVAGLPVVHDGDEPFGLRTRFTRHDSLSTLAVSEEVPQKVSERMRSMCRAGRE